jgi:glycosyltransferase involved in cell wall biosynthesis
MQFEDYKNGNLASSEYQVFWLAKELAARGYETYIFRKWYHNSPKKEEIEGIQVVNIETPDFQNPPEPTSIFGKVALSKFAREEVTNVDPDVLILTECFSSYFISSLKIPKIYVTHSNPADLIVTSNILKRRILKMVETRIFKNCDLIVALNNSIKEYLISAGWNAIYIPNGVENGLFNVKTADENFVLYTGFLHKKKGVSYLIKAYAMLSESLREKNKLVIGGHGPEQIRLQKLASNLGVDNNTEFIQWLPKHEHIEKLSKCSVFVLPSILECMPVILLEAMALKKPVIASNIPGPQEEIKHGNDGFLIERGDINDLKKYIELCLSDAHLRQRIGESASKAVNERFTFDKIALRYEDIFKSILT